MAWRTVDQLPQPTRTEFWPSNLPRNFESEHETEKEDFGRLSSTILNRRNLIEDDLPAVRSLQAHLSTDFASRDSFSLASSVDMRVVRNRLLGSLTEALAFLRTPKRLVTLIPHSWRVPSEDLRATNGRRFINQAREDLRRAGSDQVNGGLIGFLEAEYDPSTDVFAFHLHLIVWGEMLQVVERLRKVVKYKSSPGALQAGTGADHPVHVKQITPALMLAVTYILKPFWVERTRFLATDGVVRRARTKHRIKEPLHTEVLLWLHRHRLENLCLKVGVNIDQYAVRVIP